MSKTLKDYLVEAKKTFEFKIKIAGDFTSDQEKTLQKLLDKYQVSSFKKSSTTPIQALPLDFPRLTNMEVHIYDVTLDYPVAPHELVNYLGNGLRLNEQNLVARTLTDPLEEYQQPPAEYEGALLDDPDYKEVPKVNSSDYFGDEYNKSFLKALNDEAKEQRKKRGEIIPKGDNGETTNDLKQGTVSPVGQHTKGKK